MPLRVSSAVAPSRALPAALPARVAVARLTEPVPDKPRPAGIEALCGRTEAGLTPRLINVPSQSYSSAAAALCVSRPLPTMLLALVVAAARLSKRAADEPRATADE